MTVDREKVETDPEWAAGMAVMAYLMGVANNWSDGVRDTIKPEVVGSVAIREYKAHLEAQGFVIVPVEPTEEKGMEQAFMSLADDYNEVARALGFEGRGFYGDVPDRHEDIVKQAAALRAKVLTLIANDGQLIEDNRALRARVKELEGALMRVIGAVKYDQVDIRRWLDEARSILNK